MSDSLIDWLITQPNHKVHLTSEQLDDLKAELTYWRGVELQQLRDYGNRASKAFINAVIAYNEPSSEAASTAKEKRSRRTKKEVQVCTLAAIGHKIDHAEATSAECAEMAGLPRTTLEQQPDWQEWSTRIEQANTRDMDKVKREHDKRLADFT